jgi:hypothetical protein
LSILSRRAAAKLAYTISFTSSASFVMDIHPASCAFIT